MSYNPFYNGRDYNPIISIDGVALPVSPSSFDWEEEDLSNAEAGRTEDGVMHKNRIGSIRRCGLSFKNLPLQTMQKILAMFSPEYITVTYISPATDPYYGYRMTEVFYVGTRKVSVYSARLNICADLTFNIISRDPNDK